MFYLSSERMIDPILQSQILDQALYTFQTLNIFHPPIAQITKFISCFEEYAKHNLMDEVTKVWKIQPEPI